MRINISDQTPVIFTRVSQQYIYEAQKRTDKRRTDEQGRPMTRAQAFGVFQGSPDTLTVTGPDHLFEGVEAGDVVGLEGEQVKANIRGGDFGALNIDFVDFDALTRVSSAQELFESAAEL